MKNRLSLVALVGVLALPGCPPPAAPVCGMGIVCLDDTGTSDGGVTDTGAIDMGRDAPDTGPIVCNTTGRVGAHCRMGECGTGLACPMLVTGMTIQSVFMLRQGTLDDPMHPGYQGVEDPAIPANSAVFNGLSGGVCVQVCDTAAMTDGCGACADCSNILTQMPLVNAFGGALAVLGAADRTFGNDSGICRLACDYDPAERGDLCPSDMTCDAFSAVCIEECTSDAECNTVYGATYSGELVTIVNTENPQTCNMTTGRCTAAAGGTGAVGDPCDSAADCAPGTGVCLNGGQCAELGCDPMMVTGCGAGHLCLTINDRQAVCVQACNSAMTDCEPGNICNPLTMAVGGFSGFCLGGCASDDQCRATETCTDYIDDMAMAQRGQCVPRCSMPDMIGVAAGCEADEYCKRDHDGATYGFCRGLGAFCTVDEGTAVPPGQSADCGAGQICDELLATGGGMGFDGRDIFGDGHCVNPCTSDADCTDLAGDTCQLTAGSPYLGLCRTACSATVPCASANEVCDTVNSVCTEIPPVP